MASGGKGDFWIGGFQQVEVFVLFSEEIDQFDTFNVQDDFTQAVSSFLVEHVLRW